MKRGWMPLVAVVALSACTSTAPTPERTPEQIEVFCVRFAEGFRAYESFVEWTIQGGRNLERYTEQVVFVDDLRALAPVELSSDMDIYAAAVESLADDYADDSPPTIEAPGWFPKSEDLRLLCTEVLG